MRTIRFLMLCIGLTLCVNASATNNPFLPYSAAWSNRKFASCEPKYGAYWLSEDEKRIVYAINMLRTDPELFHRTILLPYIKKTGKTWPTPAMPARLTVLDPVVYATRIARGVYKYGPAVVDTLPEQPRYIWLYHQKYRDEAELVCRMLLEYRELRELLLSDSVNVIGVKKGKLNDGRLFTGIVIDDINRADILRGEVFPWYVDVQTDEDLQPIDLRSNPDDAFLRQFKKNNAEYLCETDVIFFDHKAIRQIVDSLGDHDISYRLREREESVDRDVIRKFSTQKTLDAPYYVSGSSTGSDMSLSGFDSKTGLHCYYVGRTSRSGTWGYYAKIMHLEVPKAVMFPEDSIGRERPEPSVLVTTMAMMVKKMPVDQLACALTDPYEDEFHKVQSIHDWIISNISYDNEGLAKNNYVTVPDEVIKKGKTICGGYADLMVSLCNYAGIEAEYIGGMTKGGGRHAWVAVKIRGKWYLCDPTWGSSFYLMSPEEFFKSHFPMRNKWTLLTEYRSYEAFKTMNP